MKNLNINNQIKIEKIEYELVIAERNAAYEKDCNEKLLQFGKDQLAYDNATNNERIYAIFNAKSNIKLDKPMKKAETNKQKKIDNFFKIAAPKKKIDYKKLSDTIKEINK